MAAVSFPECSDAYGLLHKPAAQAAGEARVDVLEEQVLLPPLNENGEAIAPAVVARRPRRAKVTYRLDGESPAVGPSDRQGHHGASSVKLGCYFDLDALNIALCCGPAAATFHIDHLPGIVVY